MLGMIWAQARGGVIGRDNDLPWYLPEDLAHFKATTQGQVVIMGRRQWESLPEKFRPLPGRRNLVLTRQAGFKAEGAEVIESLDKALALVEGEDAWICGGGQIYAQAIDRADVLVVTEIDLGVDGDVFAPRIASQWRVAETGDWLTSRTGLQYRILRYTRDSAESADPG